MASPIENTLLTILPVASATISAASGFYVMTLVGFPQADIVGAVVFVLALFQAWGDTSLDQI